MPCLSCRGASSTAFQIVLCSLIAYRALSISPSLRLSIASSLSLSLSPSLNLSLAKNSRLVLIFAALERTKRRCSGNLSRGSALPCKPRSPAGSRRVSLEGSRAATPRDVIYVHTPEGRPGIAYVRGVRFQFFPRAI